jgi:hypothetical protein
VEERIAEAREANGLDLYLPVQLRYRSLMVASFLVSEAVIPDGAETEMALSKLTAGDPSVVTTGTVGLAGTLAVRREYVRPADAEREITVPTRHVEYALPVPYGPRRCITVSFSTAGNGDPDSEFTKALAELFDALMTTFRWTGPDNQPTTFDIVRSITGGQG